MKMSWAFDFISPFSYFSLKQLPDLPKGTEVEFVPVLFAGLLNHYGQIGNAEIPSKRRFTYRFTLWRARQMGIPIAMPPTHPFNPLSALRLAIAANCTQTAVETIFDAVFKEGRDVSDAGVIQDLAGRLGIADVQQALSDPAVKQKLHDNTAWAISRGIFGVPTFVIGEEIFWGHDAFDMVLDYLRDPAMFNDPMMLKADSLPVGVSRTRKG